MSNYNSDYDIRLATLGALGGDTTKQYDSVYEIDLEILRLTEDGAGADIQTVASLPSTQGHEGEFFRLESNNKVYVATYNSNQEWVWAEIGTGGEIVTLVPQSPISINQNVISVDLSNYYNKSEVYNKTEVDEKIATITNTENAELEEKTTVDFTFVNELPASGETNQNVVLRGENEDKLYQYVNSAWTEQTPDANSLYFDTEGAQLYSYVTANSQFAPISLVDTIIVNGNLNSNAALKEIKTKGNYNVLQHLTNATRGSYLKNWAMTVQGVDYDEYEAGDKVYQKLVNNVTIYKRTWSNTRETNDGWTVFSTYYEGLVKDTTTSKYYTWSSQKLNNEFASKQDTLTAGTNISISGNTISADGYVYDASNGSISNKAFSPAGSNYVNSASGQNAIALGQGNTVTGEGSATIGGQEANVTGDVSVAVGGYKNTVSGSYAVVIGGQQNQATASNAVAEGYKTISSGRGAHTEGYYTVASGQGAHAEGKGGTTIPNTASNEGAHAEGIRTTASGLGAHAEGYGSSTVSNTASGNGSHVEGCLTVAQNLGEHAEGNCNVSHKNSNTEGDAGNTASSIGIAYDNSGTIRKNAREIMQNGDYYLFGVGGYQGTNTKVQDASIKTLQEVVNNTIEEVSALPTASENKSKLFRLDSGDKKVYASKLESSVTVTTDRLPDDEQIDKAYLYEEGYAPYYYKGSYKIVCSDGEIDGYAWYRYNTVDEFWYVLLTQNDATEVNENTLLTAVNNEEFPAILDTTNKVITISGLTIQQVVYWYSLSYVHIIPIPATYNAPEANQIGNATLYDTVNDYNATYTGEQVTFIDTDGGDVEVTAYKWTVPDTTDFIATSKPASEIYYYLDDENFTFTDTIIWAVYSDSSERIGTAVRNLYIPQLNAPDSEQVGHAKIYDTVNNAYYVCTESVNIYCSDGVEVPAYLWTASSGVTWTNIFSNAPSTCYSSIPTGAICDEDFYYDSVNERWTVSYDDMDSSSIEEMLSDKINYGSDGQYEYSGLVKYQRSETTETWGWGEVINEDYPTDAEIDALFSAATVIVRRALMKHPNYNKTDDYYMDEGLVNVSGETMEYDGSTYYKWWRSEQGETIPDVTQYADSRTVVLTDTLDVALPFTYQSPECKYVLAIDNNEEDSYPLEGTIFDKEALEDEDGNITYRT